MSQAKLNKRLWVGTLVAGMALFVVAGPPMPSWPVGGCGRGRGRDPKRRSDHHRSNNPAASQQAAATANAQSAANAAAAAAQQSAAAAQEAAARAATAPPAPAKTPQQKLAELQSLYDQKLISQSDYQAAKTKILTQLAN